MAGYRHAPAATRLCSPSQQESSAHGGRVSGDPIPIYGSAYLETPTRVNLYSPTLPRTYHLTYAYFTRDYGVGYLDETISARPSSNPVRNRNFGKVTPQAADTDRMSKEPEHGGIVGRVPAI